MNGTADLCLVSPDSCKAPLVWCKMTACLFDETETSEEVKEERNNNGRDEGSTENKMAKKCPICGSPMHPAGKLQIPNPLTGRTRMVQVYNCSRCGYRSLG